MAGTILLTGASGYVGSRLLRVLEEGGCRVRCLARQPSRVAPKRATTEDFLAAIENAKPTLTPEMIEVFRDETARFARA